jgi:hypothetical protein
MTPVEKEQYRFKMEGYKRQADLIKLGRGKPTPRVTDIKPSQIEIVQEGLRDEFLSGVKPRLTEIERQIADLKTRLSQESRRRDRENRPGISILTADEIKQLVTAACGDTPEFVRLYLARMRHKHWFAEEDGLKAGMENGMDVCSRELWDMFMRIRSKIIETGTSPVLDPAWFEDWFLKTAQKTRTFHQPPHVGFATFMVFAKKACARPGSITQEDILDLEGMSFPNPKLGLLSSDAFPSHMWPDACSRILYDDLARLNNTQARGWRLNVSWVNWRAEQLVRQAESPQGPNRPLQPSNDEPTQGNDRINLPALDDILRRLERK